MAEADNGGESAAGRKGVGLGGGELTVHLGLDRRSVGRGHGAGSPPREACITLMQGQCVHLSHRPVAPAPGTGRHSRGRRSSRGTGAETPERIPRSAESGYRLGDILHGKLPPCRRRVAATDETGDPATAVAVVCPYLSHSPPNTPPSCRGVPASGPISPASGRGAWMPGLCVEDALEAPLPLLAEWRHLVAGTGA